MSDFSAEWENPEFDSVPTLAENAVFRVPGCDDTVLRKLLHESYRDFCRRSAALRTWRKIRLDPNETHYPIAPLLSGEIDCVTQVKWAWRHTDVRGCKVVGDAPPVLEIPYRISRHEIIGVPPLPHAEWIQTRENVGALPEDAEPDEPQKPSMWSVWVEAVEVPHMNEERAPKAFLARYGEAIVDGALVRMMSMQGRPWSDMEKARQHGVAYENAISEARLRCMQGGPAANAGKMNALDLSGMV